MDMLKKASKNVCMSTIVVSPDPMSFTASSSSAMKTPENTERDPVDSEPAGVGDIQMDCSFI